MEAEQKREEPQRHKRTIFVLYNCIKKVSARNVIQYHKSYIPNTFCGTASSGESMNNKEIYTWSLKNKNTMHNKPFSYIINRINKENKSKALCKSIHLSKINQWFNNHK